MAVPMETQKRIDLACLIILPCILLVFAILAFLGYALGDDGETYISTTNLAAAVLVTIFPLLRYKRLFVFPYWFVGIVTACVYIYGISLFFGFYRDLWWWDEFTHWFSSTIVAMIVFFALCIMQHVVRRLEMSSAMIVMITFLVGFAFGGFWEIYEGTVDLIFDKNVMSYSIYDSLADIHMDFLGSATMALIAAIVLRKKSADELTEEIDERGIIDGFIRKHKKH